MNPDKIKAIAFDIFGTVFDVSGVPDQEKRDYVSHVRCLPWTELRLPKSWEHLPLHPDSAEGLRRLRKRYTIVTLSNCPLKLLTAMSKNAGVTWDAIIPIEMLKMYKPNSATYKATIQMLGGHPEECLMVTANPGSGDVQGASSVGMQTCLIRQNEGVRDIIELAEKLGV